MGAILFLRSLLPSWFSLIVSFVFTLVLIGGHMLMLSISGIAYPMNLNDILLQGYANYIVGPLTAAVNSNLVNVTLLALFWGMIGLAIYEGLAYGASLIYEWRVMKRSINIPAERSLRLHPLRGYFMIHLGWRILVVILTLGVTILWLPIVHFCLTNVEDILRVTTTLELFRLLGITTAWWLIIMHCYVVLLRWYVFRTRLTDDILY